MDKGRNTICKDTHYFIAPTFRDRNWRDNTCAKCSQLHNAATVSVRSQLHTAATVSLSVATSHRHYGVGSLAASHRHYGVAALHLRWLM